MGISSGSVLVRLPEEVHTGSPREAFCPNSTARRGLRAGPRSRPIPARFCQCLPSRLERMQLDQDVCYRAVKGRDRRFDGVFYTAVRTTGIYCRPSCPAITPRRRNVSFFRTAAGAQGAGYRACRRCLPDATPGSPEWDVAADVASRAMRLVADGLVEREGVDGLARALGYSTRQLNRVVTQQYGAGPLALARSRRAQTARVLIETTDLSFTDVAFAAGFASVRQFNDTVREVYAASPTELRAGAASRRTRGPSGTIRTRIAVREPFAADALHHFLAVHVVRGLEAAGPGWYERSVRLPHGPGVVRVDLADRTPGYVACTFTLADARDLAPATERTRRLLDADCDPVAVDEALGEDPLLAPLVDELPGLRVPGQLDGAEMAVQTVLGQQVSVAAARTAAARLVETHGEPLGLEGAHAVDAAVPDDGHPCGARPGVAADAPVPRPRPGRSRAGSRRRRRPARLEHRPCRDTGGAARPARDRPVDRRLRRDARAR